LRPKNRSEDLASQLDLADLPVGSGEEDRRGVFPSASIAAGCDTRAVIVYAGSTIINAFTFDNDVDGTHLSESASVERLETTSQVR
jgi:hypothetical protein